MKMFSIPLVLIALVFSVLTLAQSAPPAPAATTATALAATPVTVPAVATAINNASNAIPSALPAWVYAVASFLISEVVMRIYPTASPISWFTWAGPILSAIGRLSTKAGAFANNIVSNLPPKT